MSAESFLKSDSELAGKLSTFQPVFDKYSKVAEDATIDIVKTALEKKNHKVTVVSSKAEALQAAIDLVPEGASVHNTSSTTLTEIGLVDHLKSETKWNNLHSAVLKEEDAAKQANLRRLAYGADFAFLSCDAITQEGDFAVSDASGTRVGVFHACGQAIIVVGANKIVKDMKEAEDRIRNYCYVLESARVRAAYGWPSSNVSNVLAVHTQGLMPSKFHFIIVKESLGF